MTRMLIVAVIGALVAGCGPSALEQRVCDMYAEAGGGADHDHAYWVKYFSQPEGLAETEKLNAQNAELAKNSRLLAGQTPFRHTPHTMADSYLDRQIRANAKARAIVSARLSISLREVDAALVKCGPKGK